MTTAPAKPLDILCPKCHRALVYRNDDECGGMVEVYRCRSGHTVYVQRQQVWTD